MVFAALRYLRHLTVCLPTRICIHKINAVFRNLLFINIFKFIRADDTLLKKSFGTLRKNHFLYKISHFGMGFSKRICYDRKKVNLS